MHRFLAPDREAKPRAGVIRQRPSRATLRQLFILDSATKTRGGGVRRRGRDSGIT
jgi:hypothetical protein